MAKRTKARRLCEYGGIREALGALENQAVQTTVDTCWPGVESAHDKMQCEMVESVLSSIFEQVKVAEVQETPPEEVSPEVVCASATPSSASPEDIAIRQSRLDAIRRATESLQSQKSSVKNSVKESLSAYIAQNYCETVAKSQLHTVAAALIERQTENGGIAATLSDNESEACIAYQQRKLVETEIGELESELEAWEQRHRAQAWEPDVDAAIAACEVVELTNEDHHCALLRTEAVIHADEQSLLVRKSQVKAYSQQFCKQAEAVSQLATDLVDVRPQLARLLLRYESARKDEVTKRKLTSRRSAELERMKMEECDYGSQARQMHRMILKRTASVQQDLEDFKAMSAVIARQLESVIQQVSHYQYPYYDSWKAAQLALIDSEFEARRPVLSREIQSRDSAN